MRQTQLTSDRLNAIAAEMVNDNLDHINLSENDIKNLQSDQGETFTIEGNTLSFANNGERNKLAAIHFSEQCYLDDQCVPEKWLEAGSKLAPHKEILDLFRKRQAKTTLQGYCLCVSGSKSIFQGKRSWMRFIG